MVKLRVFLASLWLAGMSWAQARQEQPVGLMLAPGGAKIVRAGVNRGVPARAGDILFPGDGLQTDRMPAGFLYCPAKTAQNLAPGGEVVFEATQIKVKAGSLTDQKPVSTCFLPQVLRITAASQQHFGTMVARGGDARQAKPVPREKLSPAVLAELAPMDEALAANPNDIGAMVGRAVLFERNKLPANALADYVKAAEQWKDLPWLRRKIMELDQVLDSTPRE
jgi:hypothetical protein